MKLHPFIRIHAAYRPSSSFAFIPLHTRLHGFMLSSARHLSSSSSSSTPTPTPTPTAASASEDQLRSSFMSKYHRKIQQSQSSIAWQRYETEICGREERTATSSHRTLGTSEDVVKEKPYNPHTVLAIPRATFRGLVLALACCIGATLFVILRPDPISEDKERQNMHFFARLNADSNVHVTYSGLMYRVLEQIDLESDETDINLLSNPNPDIHVVSIDYEARFMDGTVFDTTFAGGRVEHGLEFPAKSLMPGLHQGIANMTRSAVFEFYCPPHLCYGERGSEFIPPHEPLIFKVKLNDFWKDQHLNKPNRMSMYNT